MRAGVRQPLAPRCGAAPPADRPAAGGPRPRGLPLAAPGGAGRLVTLPGAGDRGLLFQVGWVVGRAAGPVPRLDLAAPLLPPAGPPAGRVARVPRRVRR